MPFTINAIRKAGWFSFLLWGIEFSIANLILGALLMGAGHGSQFAFLACNAPVMWGTFIWPVFALFVAHSRKPLFGVLALALLALHWCFVVQVCTTHANEMRRYFNILQTNPFGTLIGGVHIGVYFGGQLIALLVVASNAATWRKSHAPSVASANEQSTPSSSPPKAPRN